MDNMTTEQIEIMSVLGSYKLAGNLLAVLEGVSFGLATGAIKPLVNGDAGVVEDMIKDCKEQMGYISAHIDILKERTIEQRKEL